MDGWGPVEAQYLKVGDVIIPRGKHTASVVTECERIGNQIRIAYDMLGATGRFSADYRTEIQVLTD